jgi:hypothetical protein
VPSETSIDTTPTVYGSGFKPTMSSMSPGSETSVEGAKGEETGVLDGGHERDGQEGNGPPEPRASGLDVEQNA